MPRAVTDRRAYYLPKDRAPINPDDLVPNSESAFIYPRNADAVQMLQEEKLSPEDYAMRTRGDLPMDSAVYRMVGTAQSARLVQSETQDRHNWAIVRAFYACANAEQRSVLVSN